VQTTYVPGGNNDTFGFPTNNYSNFQTPRVYRLQFALGW